MRASTSAVFFSILSVAFAFQVTSPTKSTVWSSGSGSQTLSWDRVNTDASNFTAVLVNQDNNILSSPVVLKENIPATGDKGSISFDAPSGGWKVGNSYQVNLVKDSNSLNTIYAQSEMFNITSGGSSNSASATGTKSSTSTATSGKPTATSPSDSDSASATGGDSPMASVPANGAIFNVASQTGIFAVVALAVSLVL